MALAYIGLGSNMPHEGLTPVQVLSTAVDQLRHAGGWFTCSSLYATDPVGYTGQPPFLNAVICIETTLQPLDLLDLLLATEWTFGYRHPQLGVTLQQLLAQLPSSGENGIDAVRRMPASGPFPTNAL
jgi:7,8-dihydro-6-hydroxymethylpterin-pyrophosphokinase